MSVCFRRPTVGAIHDRAPGIQRRSDTSESSKICERGWTLESNIGSINFTSN